MSNLQPTPIVDKNGKNTTVHKRVDAVNPNTRPLVHVPAHIRNEDFHGFVKIDSLLGNGSEAVSFTDGIDSFEVVRNDDNSDLYLKIFPEDEDNQDNLEAWLVKGDSALTFHVPEAREYFESLDQDVQERVQDVMKEFSEINSYPLAYMRMPEGSSPADNHSAADYVEDRLDGFDINPLINARADYAEVTEDGIAYGFNINDDYLGEVFAGKQQDNEDDDDYRQRKLDGVSEHWEGLTQLFKDEYDADLGEGNGEDYSTLEFLIAYEDGGAQASSIEYMGDRVENETKLLDFNNDYNYGHKIQSAIAQKFGYSFELSTDARRQHGDGFWVKDVGDE